MLLPLSPWPIITRGRAWLGSIRMSTPAAPELRAAVLTRMPFSSITNDLSVRPLSPAAAGGALFACAAPAHASAIASTHAAIAPARAPSLEAEHADMAHPLPSLGRARPHPPQHGDARGARDHERHEDIGLREQSRERPSEWRKSPPDRREP